MKEENYIKLHSPLWKDLENMCLNISQRGIKNISSTEIKHFLNLFRQSSHHLAYAKTHYPSSSLVCYLNALVSKCNTYVYMAPKISIADAIKYIFIEYPSLLKTFNKFILFSFGCFAFGFLMSLVLVIVNKDYASLFLQQGIIDSIIAGEMGKGEWNYPLMSSYIMVNNISVSLRAFVFGITLGLGTLYILFYNGAMLGALTALVYTYGDPLKYWSLILPHGIIELTAIFISGGAGLIIAKSLLIPGDLSRKHAFVSSAKKSLTLIGGVVFLLIIAGIIEGFYTPLPINTISKLVFAGLTAMILGGYFSIPYIKKLKHK